MSCIFCKIIDGKIPSTKVFENEHVIAIRDINPVAPVHVLVIPKTKDYHLDSILDITKADGDLIVEIHKAIKEVAVLTGICKDGFRIINNCGKFGGQTVDHLHFQVIGGKNMGERLI